jgi:hypothetical protein
VRRYKVVIMEKRQRVLSRVRTHLEIFKDREVK